MIILGLTGSIGMGKSSAATRFRSHGVAVFDADAAVHHLYEGDAVAPVEAAFRGVSENGRIDRAKLSAMLLKAPHRFAELEAIVHPLVRKAERDFLHEQASQGAAITVLEIPLLFESGADKLVDAVVVVSSTPEQQRQRVMQRPGMTEEKLNKILARQLNDEEKRRRADFVVDTSGTIPQGQAQVDAILESAKQLKPNAFKTHWA